MTAAAKPCGKCELAERKVTYNVQGPIESASMSGPPDYREVKTFATLYCDGSARTDAGDYVSPEDVSDYFAYEFAGVVVACEEES